MPTRSRYDPTAGDVYTAANYDKLPGGWIGYDTSSSDATTSGTTELTLHTLSVPVSANRKVRISFHAGRMTGTVAADSFTIRLYIDNVQVGTRVISILHTTEDYNPDCFVSGDITGLGSKTCKVTIQRGSGTGTATIFASATGQREMLVEDLGPTS